MTIPCLSILLAANLPAAPSWSGLPVEQAHDNLEQTKATQITSILRYPALDF